MTYITVREAAEKWQISQRLVQKYCAAGRIEGAKKFGVSWLIPNTAPKPQDPRKQQGAPSAPFEDGEVAPPHTGLMPLMNTSFRPGECLLCLQRMEPGPRQEIAWAEYYYFSGQPERAIEKAEQFLHSPDMDTQLSACLIYAYANLSVGDIQTGPAGPFQAANHTHPIGPAKPRLAGGFGVYGGGRGGAAALTITRGPAADG